MIDEMTDTTQSFSPGNELSSISERYGFTPNESIVIQWLNNGSVALSQRVDLAPSQTPEGVTAILDPMSIVDPDSCRVFVYGDTGVIHPSFLEQLSGSVTVECFLCVDVKNKVFQDRLNGGEWESFRVEQSVDVTREQLDQMYSPATHRDASALPESPDMGWVARSAGEVMDALNDPSEVTVDTWCELASLVNNVKVRDLVLYQMVETGESLMDACVPLATSLRSSQGTNALVIAAAAAWIQGNGARANMAVDRALEGNPEHVLARMISASLQNGLHPNIFIEAIGELSTDDVLAGVAPE
jgi:hypothetical protein